MIAIERQGEAKSWRLLLVGIKAVASVKGGTVESSPQGVLVTPMLDTDYVEIRLDVTG